jgi:hypothetical protein
MYFIHCMHHTAEVEAHIAWCTLDRKAEPSETIADNNQHEQHQDSVSTPNVEDNTLPTKVFS